MIRMPRWAHSRVHHRARSPSRSTHRGSTKRQFIDERTRSTTQAIASTGRGGRAAPRPIQSRVEAALVVEPRCVPAPGQHRARAAVHSARRRSANHSRAPTTHIRRASPDGSGSSSPPMLRSDSLVARERDSVAKLPPTRAQRRGSQRYGSLHHLGCRVRIGQRGVVQAEEDRYGNETSIVSSQPTASNCVRRTPGNTARRVCCSRRSTAGNPWTCSARGSMSRATSNGSRMERSA
jgi:hypothetical protein